MPSTMPLFIMNQPYSITCLELFRSRLVAHLLLNFYFIVLFGSALTYLLYKYNKLNDRMEYVRRKYRHIKKKCLSGMIMETLCEDLSSDDEDSDESDDENEEQESESSYEMDEENEEDYRIEDEDEAVDEFGDANEDEDYDIVDETDIPEETDPTDGNDDNVKGLKVIGTSIPIHKPDISYNLRSKTKLVDYSDEEEAADEATGNNSEEHILKSSQYVFNNCGEF